MSRRLAGAISGGCIGLACAVLAAGSLWRGVVAAFLLLAALLIREDMAS